MSVDWASYAQSMVAWAAAQGASSSQIQEVLDAVDAVQSEYKQAKQQVSTVPVIKTTTPKVAIVQTKTAISPQVPKIGAKTEATQITKSPEAANVYSKQVEAEYESDKINGVELPAETLLKSLLDNRSITYEFQTALLHGRTEMGNIEAPFLLEGGVAVCTQQQLNPLQVQQLNGMGLVVANVRPEILEQESLQTDILESIQRAVEYGIAI